MDFTWKHVLSIHPQTGTPIHKYFQDTLPIESLEEQRLILPGNDRAFSSPVMRGLLKVKGLESLALDIQGGMYREVQT